MNIPILPKETINDFSIGWLQQDILVSVGSSIKVKILHINVIVTIEPFDLLEYMKNKENENFDVSTIRLKILKIYSGKRETEAELSQVYISNTVDSIKGIASLFVELKQL